jgi:hypothetical protein
MTKLKLDLDALLVETFETAADRAAGVGTVLAHYKVPPAEPATIDPCVPYSQSCDISCNGSCVNTCQASCYDTCAGQYSCDQSCSPLARCVPPAY